MTEDLQPFVPNTVPLPNVACLDATPALAPADENDLFSKGVVIKYFQNQSYGFVRDHIGRELFFHVDEMDFFGAKNNKSFITVGARIGYDVSRTSHGLRIRRIKIY